jgi:hypothetical protein
MQFNGLEASLLLIAGFIGFTATLMLAIWVMYYCLSHLGRGR